MNFYKTLFVSMALTLGFLHATAQNNWDGDSPVGNFSFCNNWYSNACPGTWSPAIDLLFNYNNGAQTSIYYDLGTTQFARDIRYMATYPSGIPFDTNGNGLIFSGKFENLSNFTQTINIQTIGVNATAIEVNPVNGNLIFNVPVLNSNNVNFNVYGNNGKKLTFNSYPSGNASVKLFLKQYSIVEVNYNNAASLSGGYVVESGELWVNSNGVIQGPIQVGNSSANFNKIYISHAATATTVANAITIPTNSPNATVGALNSSNTHTYSGTINFNNNDVYFDEVSAGGTVDFTGIISGTGGIRKINPGRIKLSAANTYTGTTAVNAGTLQLGIANAIGSSSNVVLNSGTLSTGAVAGFSDTAGTLALTDNSTIALGSGSHILTFAASNAVAWTAAKTLTITGWGYNCGSGRIFVGNSATGLTAAQLAQITFSGFPGGAKITAAGELIPNNIVLTATGGTLTGSYFTLKTAFDAINAGTHSGTIVISVVNDTVETLAAVLNNNAGATSVLIQPAGCGARTISGSFAAPMIDFNGADNVTVNGLNAGGNSLTITNTSTSAVSGTCTIRFQTDATFNTITNCSILGSSSSATGTNGGNIWFGSSAISTGNDNNTVSNCNIGPGGVNLPSKGIYFSGTVGKENSDILIANNNIFDFFSSTVNSAGIDIGSGSTLVSITGNKFYQTAARTITANVVHYGISINNGTGNSFVVTGNTIGYDSASGTGTYAINSASSANFTQQAIRLAVGNTAASSIQGNTIAGITTVTAPNASTTVFTGIIVGSGYVNVGDVTGNNIGLPLAPIDIATTTPSGSIVYGIYAASLAPATLNIRNNTIQSITQTGLAAAPLNFSGISMFGTAPFDARNNTIGNIIAANSISIGTLGISTGVCTVKGITASATANLTIGALGSPNIIQNMIVNATASNVIRGIETSSVNGTSDINYNLIRGFRVESAAATASTFNGISPGVATSTLTISHNQLGDATYGLINYAAACSTFFGILTSPGTSTGSVNIVANDITGVNHAVVTASQEHYYNNNIAAPVVNMTDNTFTNLVSNTTGATDFLVNTTSSPAGGVKNISNNRIVGTFSKPSASGNTFIYYDSASSAAGTTVTNSNNDFSNITLAGTNTINGWYNQEAGFTVKTISGNTFNNWAVGTGTIQVINSTYFGSGSVVSNNIISNITSTGTITGIATGSNGNAANLIISGNNLSSISGGSTLYGINSSTPSSVLATTIQNNTFTGLSTTSGILYGIYDVGSSPTKSYTGNTISNTATTGSTLYGIMGTAGTTISATNNTISSLSSTSNALVCGISVASPTTSGTITGNTINAFTSTNTGSLANIRGIDVSGTTPIYVNNNTIANFNGAGSNSTTSVVGISNSSTNAAAAINGNTISGLNNTNTAAAAIGVAAIYTTNAVSGGTVSNNRIYGLTNASTSALSSTVGYLANGGNWTTANNMISIINNNLAAISGIKESASSTNKYYYNSVYIAGSAAGTAISAALLALGSADLKNNILMNNRSGTGKNYALSYSGAFPGMTSNYNILNSADPTTVATSGNIDLNFPQWQAASGNDANSYSAIPINFTDVNTADLHILSLCSDTESNGTPISVTDDYDGAPRNGLTPDIGADEYSGAKPTNVIPSPSAAICLGGNTVLSASSSDPTYVYTWSPASGLSATTGATVTANPTVTTTYTVTATSPSGCVKTKFITITVNPVPTVITVAPASATACLNTIQAFTAGPVSSSSLPVGTATGTSLAANTPYRQGVSTSESRVQYIITKAELNALGLVVAAKITSLGFNVTAAGTGAMPNYTISMANTAAATASATYITAGFTSVYSTTNLTPVSGLNTHTFSPSFAWDGTSNIVINICSNGSGGTASTVKTSTFASPMTTSGIAVGQCSIATGATNLVRPVMILGIENPITWTPITELYTDAAATLPYVTGTHYTTVYTKPTIPRVYTAAATVLATGCNVSSSGTFATGASTWNGATWSPSTPVGNTSLNFTGNYNSSGNLSGCSCIVSSGNVIFASPDTLTLTNGLAVNAGPTATLTFKNNASLVQLNDAAVNSGSVTVERITQPMYRFDYTYWGSPVTQASNFTLGNLSPATLSDKYFSWTPSVSNNFGTWFYESSATVMIPAKGYIVRAPQYFSYTNATLTPYTANFVGTPNNGIITTPIYHGTQPSPNYNDDYNLLSNPYASAIDAEKFLSDAANVPVLDGTIYFWTHNSQISISNPDPFYGDFIYNYNANDYASWNKLGGTGTTSAAGTGGAVPGGYIATGQGFFTRSAGAASGALATFNNAMRVAGNNNQFFRNIQNATTIPTTSDFEKQRIWLNLISDGGTFSQILVGYATGATLGCDRDFDGEYFAEGNSVAFYSVVADNKLVIQGRPLPFTDEDLVPLGFRTSAPDTFSFRIDHYDGLFENQNIYIEDQLLGIIHDLKVSPYTFTATTGTFNGRFVLRYKDVALATANFTDTVNIEAFINEHRLHIESSEAMESITVFDISGKQVMVFSPEMNRKSVRRDFPLTNGVYLLKIRLSNGTVVTKKLMN